MPAWWGARSQFGGFQDVVKPKRVVSAVSLWKRRCLATFCERPASSCGSQYSDHPRVKGLPHSSTWGRLPQRSVMGWPARHLSTPRVVSIPAHGEKLSCLDSFRALFERELGGCPRNEFDINLSRSSPRLHKMPPDTERGSSTDKMKESFGSLGLQ